MAQRVERLPLPSWFLAPGPEKVEGDIKELEGKLQDHLVIVGFGVNGRNLARAASVAGIPYVVLETNPETVRRERGRGERIFFGDASYPEVLHHAGVERARILVSAISDPGSTRRIVELGKRMNPGLFVVARTRYLQEVEPLSEAGADEVIPEEFETSVEILVRVLRRYLIPQVEIEEFVADVRSGGYEMFRKLAPPGGGDPADLVSHLPDSEVGTVQVGERSFLVGRTLKDAALRAEYGITLLAVQRGGRTHTNPGAEFMFEAGDILIVFGGPRQVVDAAALARGADAWKE